MRHAQTDSLTAGEIAAALHAELRGDAERVVSGAAPLAEAVPSELSWLGHARYEALLAKTRAGVVLLKPGAAPPPGSTAIFVDDPDLALAQVLQWLAPRLEPVPPGVHPSAVINDGAEIEGACIGPGVYIGPRAHVAAGAQLHANVYVGADARIGPDCVLWPNVVVRERCTLGMRVVVHSNSVIGADGFSYLQRGGRNIKVPQIGAVVIEDDVEIGANTCIDRARSGATRIGRGTKIDNLVQIGHNVQIAENCIIVSQTGISGSAAVGENAILAGQCGVGDHVRIGARAVVLGQAGAGSDVPDGQTVRGTPAVHHAQYARERIAVTRLPELLKEIRGLRRRIEELESAKNDRTRS